MYRVFQYFCGTSQGFLSWGLGPERKGIRRTAYGSKREASSWSGSRRNKKRRVCWTKCQWINETQTFHPQHFFQSCVVDVKFVVCCPARRRASDHPLCELEDMLTSGVEWEVVRRGVKKRENLTVSMISQVVKLSGLTSHMITWFRRHSHVHLPQFVGFSGLSHSFFHSAQSKESWEVLGMPSEEPQCHFSHFSHEINLSKWIGFNLLNLFNALL